MEYVNKVTGAIIETSSVLAGGDWEIVTKEKAPAGKAKTSKAKSATGDETEGEE